MSNIDALLQLVKEAQGAAVQVGDDLDHDTPHGCGVDRLQRVGASAKVENTKLTQEQDEPFLGVVGHLLQAVVNVAALLEHGEPWVIDVTALLLVRSVGFRDAFGQLFEPLHQAVELLFSRLNDVLHGLVDAEAGKQHRPVGRGGDDAHLLEP